jgi:beta-phosphoglucomutase
MAALALMFDLDGVLIDSNPLHTQAWLLYLKECGVSADRLKERMHGKRNDQIVRDLFGGSLSDEEVFAHGARKEALYREMMRPHLKNRLVPGVAEFLARHRQAAIGLASNAEPANVHFVLDNSGLACYFRVIVDGHQVSCPKPDPEVYRRTAELLGVEPASSIVFEDSPAGVAAARGAGARVVGVETTNRDLDGVELSIPDFLDPRLEAWLSEQIAA